MIAIFRVIGCHGMIAIDLNPTHRVTRLNMKADRIKIDLSAILRHDGTNLKGTRRRRDCNECC